MATPLEIFDRENLVKLIDRDCLAESGTSAAIVGAHKVGKTHLLRHITSRPPKSQESLFCNIDLDLLRASLKGGESFSDDVFLRFFLSRLVRQIDGWIRSQDEEKELWSSDIRKAEQDLASLNSLASAGPAVQQLREQLREQHVTLVSALKQRLRQLKTLETIGSNIRALLKQKEPLAVHQVVYVFDDLKDLKKRIVLIIDEFDNMLKQKGFSDALFSFLRGANNDGKIIALVTSRVHLMDESLHGDHPSERISLVNHFRLQLLDPFDGREATDFLDWFAAATPPLTADEKSYVQKLGGGSPYFLKEAREQFINRGRPSTPEACEAFEQMYLSALFEDGFLQIWNRLAPEELAALRQVANGVAPDALPRMKLEREGYLIRSDSGVSLFSPLFSDFVKRQPAKGRPSRPTPTAGAAAPAPSGMFVEPLEITVDLPFKVIPSSLYFAYPELGEVGVVTVTNYTKVTQQVLLSCELVEYSQKTDNTVDVPPGTHTFKLNVVLHKEKLAGLMAPVATQVKCEVRLHGDNGLPRIKTQVVRLLPKDNFLMARFDPATGQLMDFSWLITAWVNNRDDGLQAVHQRALALDPQFGQSVPSGDKGWERVKKKVAALYGALNEMGFSYDDSTLIFHQAENDYVQRVRLISETLGSRLANCLDGAVLFASLLAMADLEPAILLTPGHAMVGWKDRKGSGAKWEFLEITKISISPFADAWEMGQRGFRKVKDFYIESALDTPLTFDPENFAILIDVRKIWQQRKISLL
jgi:hypothetical protein